MTITIGAAATRLATIADALDEMGVSATVRIAAYGDVNIQPHGGTDADRDTVAAALRATIAKRLGLTGLRMIEPDPKNTNYWLAEAFGTYADIPVKVLTPATPEEIEAEQIRRALAVADAAA